MSDLRNVHTDQAPAAIGPYSQAVIHQGIVYCSGQIALDPARGTIVAGDVVAQAEQVMRNLSAVLSAAGSSLGRALKVSIFLVNMEDFASVNDVYARYLGDHRPARATVAVRELPKGARVEIDCVAALAP